MLDALLVMMLGMGGVAIFLVILVFVIQSLTKLFPAPPASATSDKLNKTGPVASGPAAGAQQDLALIAVIQAAITSYDNDINKS